MCFCTVFAFVFKYCYVVFDPSLKLDDMLRDRLVCGIDDSAMQTQLLAEGDALSLRDTVKHKMSMELAEKDTQDLKGEKGMMSEETANATDGRSCQRSLSVLIKTF